MRFNEEKQIKICKNYKVGKSCLELAEQYSCHYQTILSILRKHDIPRRTASENTFNQWRTGKPIGKHKQMPIKNFQRHYIVTKSGCWQWTAAKRRGGYGEFGICKKSMYAHRFSYIFHKGTIPKGFTIDHLCRNRLCVNPDHLEAVTLRENILRGIGPAAQNARKTHCTHGHPFSGNNLYILPDGRRSCRTCNNHRQIEYQQRKRNQ